MLHGRLLAAVDRGSEQQTCIHIWSALCDITKDENRSVYLPVEAFASPAVQGQQESKEGRFALLRCSCRAIAWALHSLCSLFLEARRLAVTQLLAAAAHGVMVC